MEKTKRMRKTRTEIVDKTTANPFAVRLFTCCAYAVAARARKVRGKEKAHHATLNSFIDFLKSIGRLAKDVNRNKDRKNSILHWISKLPLIDFQAKAAMLGAATKRKKTGLSLEGM